jgi:hypothetical protein
MAPESAFSIVAKAFFDQRLPELTLQGTPGST